MSHETGKVEILNVDRKTILMRYHQAKHEQDQGRFFTCHRDDNAYWLDQLKPVE